MVLLTLVVAPPGRAAEGTTEVRSFATGGQLRTYRLYRPADLSGTVPLVMMLHGGFGSGAQAQRSYGWDDAADAGRFLVAYPDGRFKAWNAGTCCGWPARTGVDDVGFLGALLDHLVATEGVDPGRFYVAGMSNGAMMAYRLACELPGRLAAIGPVAGTMTVPCGSAAPTSVLHIHGMDDRAVPYEGGVGEGFGRDHRPPVPATIAHWRAVDACGAATVTTDPPVTTDNADCALGTTVRLVTIEGAGHQWPGSTDSALAGLVLDPPSTALDATAELWAFFSTKTRP
jgi:polyhydroxybutyrate depolymerase